MEKKRFINLRNHFLVVMFEQQEILSGLVSVGIYNQGYILLEIIGLAFLLIIVCMSLSVLYFSSLSIIGRLSNHILYNFLNINVVNLFEESSKDDYTLLDSIINREIPYIILGSIVSTFAFYSYHIILTRSFAINSLMTGENPSIFESINYNSFLSGIFIETTLLIMVSILPIVASIYLLGRIEHLIRKSI